MQAQPAADWAYLQKELPPIPYFDDWQKRTGELPPDFTQMPKSARPLPLLTTLRGGSPHPVTAAEWPERRAELRGLVERWILGDAPPAPGNVRAVIESKTAEATHEVWTLRLEFGPDHAAKLPCWLWVPHGAKDAPLPVFVTDAPRTAQFGVPALKAGKLAILIYGANDRDDASKAYKDLFGEFGWEDLRRRGWSASRALDWLTTLDFVDPQRIYIGGHSRSAKAALAAAAFDDRFAGVIASSPGGGGGSMNFVLSDQYYFYASAEGLTRNYPTWRVPRLRFFTGRENQLPADNHMIYALVAPRPLLMSTALHDSVEHTWGIERVFESLRDVYSLLGQPGNLGLRYRPGLHAPDEGAYAAFNEFLLQAIDRKNIAEAFPYQPYHPWDYKAWAAAHPPARPPSRLPADAGREQVVERVRWLLGDAPPPTALRPEFKEPAAAGQPAKLVYGNGLVGDLYYPPAPLRTAGQKLPAVLWLGPFNTAVSYRLGPGFVGEAASALFTKAGFALMSYDPIATRDRHEERRVFYEKHPDWSLMGKMVQDARDALAGLAARPDVDPTRIYVVGYAMGGMVASYLMALDERPAGAVMVAGFTPFRTDTDDRGTGGVRRWSHDYGWLPRLGTFVGREQEIPVDFDQILAAAAPKPMLVIAPRRDWHSTHAEVAAAVAAAQRAYRAGGAAGALTLESPDRWLEYNESMQTQTVDWLRQQLARP
ncbi:MAG TPA: dienelactone hydrolase family protein [Opitutaceae bacterium]